MLQLRVITALLPTIVVWKIFFLLYLSPVKGELVSKAHVVLQVSQLDSISVMSFRPFTLRLVQSAEQQKEWTGHAHGN